jgi:hypothetical protein
MHLFKIKDKFSRHLSKESPYTMKSSKKTSASSFGGYSKWGSDSVFLDCFWVNMGCVRWGIHASPLKAVSGGYIWVGSDSVFLDCLWVNRGCVGWRIHSSPVKAVSGAISEWAATPFSLTLSESTGAVCADESMCQLWKQFHDDFWVGSDSVFLDYFWVKRGCVRRGIHASPMKAVSGAISE